MKRFPSIYSVNIGNQNVFSPRLGMGKGGIGYHYPSMVYTLPDNPSWEERIHGSSRKDKPSSLHSQYTLWSSNRVLHKNAK